MVAVYSKQKLEWTLVSKSALIGRWQFMLWSWEPLCYSATLAVPTRQEPDIIPLTPRGNSYVNLITKTKPNPNPNSNSDDISKRDNLFIKDALFEFISSCNRNI